MLTLNEKEMVIVANEFEITVNVLKEMIEKDDIAVFQTFEKFFHWIHDGKTEEQLINYLLDGINATDYAEYHKLECGKTVFMYQ